MLKLGNGRKKNSPFHVLQDGCLKRFIKKMQSILHMKTCNPVGQLKHTSSIIQMHNVVLNASSGLEMKIRKDL